MALTARLDLRQSQSLVMTPQLQQAIKLLQLTNLELSAYVDAELERNPLLERDDRREDGIGDAEETLGEERRDRDEPVLDKIAGQDETPLDIDYDNSWSSDTPGDAPEFSDMSLANWSGQGGRSDFEDPNSDYEQVREAAPSLREHMVAQLNVDIHDPGDRIIGLYLIDLVDDAGWITESLAEVARVLNCEVSRVESVLRLLQAFDPPGICARTLRECLALQLKDRNRLDPAMQALLGRLDLLAKRDMKSLMQICGVDAEDLADMVHEIRALNPKPALAFDHAIATPITPDVLMRTSSDGGWIIELNSETLPRLLIDTRYFTKISKATQSKEDRNYLAENLQSANWLVKSLHQRATTILKVASEIVRQQDAFFARGVSHLRPLVLRDIASAIEMHESTVSRVTSNKYMATPRGIYELKYFFTQAIAATDGADAHSAEAVRHRIKELVDQERPSDILSDETIVKLLKAGGIEIARRTVAKYREAMRIPSSAQRRQEKSMRTPKN
ncbi:MAG: RNA polymerase factor sigma-54 [Alphaproteobacteria bacterium]|nr:RNA polymerase factor sigma-54 [Alphaproteobacteria bacterium]